MICPIATSSFDFPGGGVRKIDPAAAVIDLGGDATVEEMPEVEEAAHLEAVEVVAGQTPFFTLLVATTTAIVELLSLRRRNKLCNSRLVK